MTTLRWTAVGVAVVALAAAPAAFAAPPGASPNANQQSPGQRCAAQLKKEGASAFKELYAQDANANQKNAFGKCVSKLTAQDQQNAKKASALCRAEQADTTGFAATHDKKTFDQVYGTGKKLKNAFGNCVSSKANAASQEQQESTIKAAKTCRTLQADLKTFTATYGAKKNAFGKCVAAHTNA